MLFHHDSLFSIAFGDKKNSFKATQFYNVPTTAQLLAEKQFQAVNRLIPLEHLLVLKQTHSIQGYAFVTPDDVLNYRPYLFEGDYIITNLSHVGLGVATADCLPIVVYDSHHHAIALIHAGWRGSVGHIAIRALEHMQRVFGTQPAHIKVFFGPSARVCCYVVDEAFMQQIPEVELHDDVFRECKGQLFFDLPLYNRLLLERVGVDKGLFHLEYNVCTICSDTLCSYRRDGEKANRQMTIVALK